MAAVVVEAAEYTLVAAAFAVAADVLFAFGTLETLMPMTTMMTKTMGMMKTTITGFDTPTF